MAVALLLPRHIFGLKGDVAGPMAFYDEQTVVYPAGHNTIIHNLEQRTQKFLTGTEKSEEITAMCVSPNKKFVAVAEKAEKGMITIFDLTSLKKKRPLTCAESVSKEYVSLAFSPDSKYLMAQGGAPDWLLCLWTWEKNPPKLIATAKTTNALMAQVHACSFSLTDNNNIAVVGNGILKQLRLTESAMKLLQSPLGQREPENFVSHAWLSDERLVVGTDTGGLLIIEGSELKVALSINTSPPIEGEKNGVACICVYSKGFAVGSYDGTLSLFEPTDTGALYHKNKSFRIESNLAAIRHMSISPTEESLILCQANNQAFQFPLLNADILKHEEEHFTPLTSSFHSGAVTGLDVCIRKPLIATCSEDKTVRVWNYLDKTLEYVKTFSDEAFSIALHPSGLHVLVGFADKLRLMNILNGDVRLFKEFPIKQCRECRFSDGGQYFAAVNTNTIQIYSTYTCEMYTSLRGHNGKVLSLSWVADDTKLVSCGMDGAVYQWEIKRNNREMENVLKSCQYTCAVSDGKEGKTIYAVGNDKQLKMVTGSNTSVAFDTPVVLVQVVLSYSGRMLFCASETGTIFSYKFPLQSPGEYQEYMCHHGPVNRLRMSYDDSYLFAVGQDGCVVILDVRDKEGHLSKKDKEMLPFAEEVLVTKSDLEEKTALQIELDSKVEELQHQNDYQIRLKDMSHAEKIKELVEKQAMQLEKQKAKYDLLLQAKNDMEMECEEKIKQIEERHASMIENLDRTYQTKIMAEVEAHQKMEREKEELNEKWDEQNAQLVDGHERLVQELTDDYEYKLQEERMHVEHLKEEKDELMRQIEETRRQVEEDADQEIVDLNKKYDAKLNHEKENNLGLKGQNGIMKKKFLGLQKEILERTEDMNIMEKKRKELEQEIYRLKKEIAQKRKEVTDRDSMIAEKERKIYDLKKKNQELEKFKFVLDYKIKELKKQLEPRDAEIQKKKEEIKKMDEMLEKYHKKNSKLEEEIAEMKESLDTLKKELADQRKRNQAAEIALQRYRTQLHECVQHIQQPKLLKDSVKKLYQSHVNETIVAAQLDADIAKEYNRQREYLEKSVDSLKKKLGKDMELHRSDNVRVMLENVSLIKEINELRKEIKSMKQSQRAKELSGSGAKGPGGALGVASELEMNRGEIRRLRERLQELEANTFRPKSREQLPPLDGYGGTMSPTQAPTETPI